MAKSKKNSDDIRESADHSTYNSYMLVHKGRRFRLTVAVASISAICTLIICHGMAIHQSWLDNALILASLGSATLIFKPSEEWQYQPWQARAQRLEKMQNS